MLIWVAKCLLVDGRCILVFDGGPFLNKIYGQHVIGHGNDGGTECLWCWIATTSSCLFSKIGPPYHQLLSLLRLVLELEEGGLLLEVAHPIGMTILEVSLHNIENGRVVALQVLRYFADRYTVNFMLINDAYPLSMRYEFFLQPLLLIDGWSVNAAGGLLVVDLDDLLLQNLCNER